MILDCAELSLKTVIKITSKLSSTMIHAACATFCQHNFITLYISEAIYSNTSLGEYINSNYIIHQ